MLQKNSIQAKKKKKEAIKTKKKKIKEMRSQWSYYNRNLSNKSGERGSDLGHQTY